MTDRILVLIASAALVACVTTPLVWVMTRFGEFAATFPAFPAPAGP